MLQNYSRTIFCISILIFLFFVFQFWDYSIDDAFITFRYAENFVDGFGLTFTPGDMPVEGYSNFLWLQVLALAYKFGISVYPAAKVLGVMLFLLAAIIWYKKSRDFKFKYINLTAPLFLITPISAFWAVSGLEVGLYAVILTGLAMAVAMNTRWSLFWLIMLVLVRPEGFAVGTAILMAAFIADWRNKTINKSYHISNGVILILATIAMAVFRIYVFGHPFPNTVYAKSVIATDGLLRLIKGLLYYFPLTLLFLFGVYKIIREKRYNKTLIIFAGAFMAQAFINCLADAVMNFHIRYIIAFLPFFIAVALYGLSKIDNLKVVGIVLILSVASLAAPLKSVYASLEQEQEIIKAQEGIIEFINKQPENIRISMTDIGRVPYYTRAKYYDLWGLASADIGHNGFDALKELLRFPDYFVFVGYLENGKPKLRFGRERMIMRHKFFDKIYDLSGVGLPDDADISNDGYYYLAFLKNQSALDSLLKIYPLN